MESGGQWDTVGRVAAWVAKLAIVITVATWLARQVWSAVCVLYSVLVVFYEAILTWALGLDD